MNKYIDQLGLLTALYTSLFLISPILSNNIVSIGGVKLISGIITMSIAYGILDVINEHWGMVKARQTVITAGLVRLFIWVSIFGIMYLPSVHSTPNLEKIIINSFRILLAGEVAMIVSQYFVDTWIFNKIKEMFSYKFWVRYSISTVISQFVSLTLFIVLAFGGTPKPIVSMILGGLLVRLTITLLGAPLMTLLSSRIKTTY